MPASYFSLKILLFKPNLLLLINSFILNNSQTVSPIFPTLIVLLIYMNSCSAKFYCCFMRICKSTKNLKIDDIFFMYKKF